MDKEILKDNFLEMIQDVYDAENRIIDALPDMIEAASYEDLKEAFHKHLEETKGQAARLEKVFELLNESPKEKTCYAMKGLIKEGKEIIHKKELTQALKDCCLITAAQKIEHYEIATYGALCAFVKHLNKSLHDKKFEEILHLLTQNLEEEKKTNHKLTELAEGTRTMQGINDEAEKEIVECCCK